MGEAEDITDASREFRELMTRFQNSTDPEESIRLRDQLVREVFDTPQATPGRTTG